MLLCAAAPLLVPVAPTFADEPVANGPNTASGPISRAALPLRETIVDADAVLRGRRADTWVRGGSRFILLEGDAGFELGSYGFVASRALVQIDTEIVSGRRLRFLSVYLDDARSNRDDRPIAAAAKRLLVTATTTGEVDIKTDLLRQQSRADEPFFADADARIKRYLAALVSPMLPVPQGGPLWDADAEAVRTARRNAIREALGRDVLADSRLSRADTDPRDDGPQPLPTPTPVPTPTEDATPDEDRGIDRGDSILSPETILGSRGSFTYAADRIVLQRGEAGRDTTLALIGDVRLFYSEGPGLRSMTLQAERAVVFIREKADADAEIDEPRGPGALSGSEVAGVYLEDNVVATDGEYTVRAPRVYYDLQRNRAVLLEAVLYTWNVKRQIPLYLRAEKLQQVSRRSWEAQQAVLTTSEFAEPHFSIAADRLTMREEADAAGATEQVFTARNTTARWGDVPIFYWPRVTGRTEETSLRRVSVGFDSNNGPEVLTQWDFFSLLGREAPQGVDARLSADYRGDHGPAVGLAFDYVRPRFRGEFDSYLLFHDQGEDTIGRRDIDHDGDVRGWFRLQHRHYLRDRWELSLQLGYFSDETFLEEFFTGVADADRPIETSLYLKRQDEDAAITFLAAYDLQRTVENTAMLQSPGYTVDKSPELAFHVLGRSLWDDRLTWYSETRLSRLRIRTGGETPFDRGFNDMQSLVNFGFASGTPFDAGLAPGIPQGYRLRFFTRQEVQAPMRAGIIDVVPYVTGRAIAYDQDFDTFAGEDEQVLLAGTVGVRLHTQFSRVFPDVQSRLLDLHQLRHIIEPSIDASLTSATFNPEDIPVYDPQVEGFSEGMALRLGLRNTLETKRGGPGRWRSVEWLVIDTDLVLRSDDAPTGAELARFFTYRPEAARGGDHFYTRAMWMVSDTLAVAGDLTYSLEDSDVPAWSIGAVMRHSTRLTTSLSYSEIKALESRLLSLGLRYRLTTKYTVALGQTFDLDGDGETRATSITLERRLPRWRLLVTAGFDDIDDDTRVAVLLIPEGISTGQFLTPLGPIFDY